MKKEDFNIKTPKDKVAKDFEIEIPRINIDHDEETGQATINFGFDNFDRDVKKEKKIDE